MQDQDLSRKTALIIDDELFMRDFLSTVVEKVGIGNVMVTSSGHQALDLISSSGKPIDFIFCDLQMPEMDGVEVIRHLVDLNYSGGVVLFTGEDQRILETVHGIAEKRGLKLIGSLAKPVSVESLYQLLANYNVVVKKSSSSVPEVSVEELQTALQEGDIIPYFQPQIEIKSGAIKGVEALARWNHEKKGMIPPDIFSEMAEQHQLIDALTNTIVEQTCRQSVSWFKRGYQFKVSINLSMDNLNKLDFPDQLAALVKSTGMDIRNLIFEITESRFEKDACTCLDILARLRLKGASLSIDDFGTGYATMEHLKQMPFTELKIDREFVSGAHTNGKARAILESSIYLAKQLKITTVAEGVETKEDWDLVQALGCDRVQGYYIACPMDIDSFDSWLEARRFTAFTQTMKLGMNLPTSLAASNAISIK